MKEEVSKDADMEVKEEIHEAAEDTGECAFSTEVSLGDENIFNLKRMV